MAPITALASALGIAWSSSVSLYATVAFTGVAGRLGWVMLPEGLRALENPTVIGVAWCSPASRSPHRSFLESRPPGRRSTCHPAGGGGRAGGARHLGGQSGARRPRRPSRRYPGRRHRATKLKLRTAIDASPEPLSNAVATGAEVGTVAGMAWLVWNHPWIALALAIATLAALILVARAIWRALRRAATWVRGG